MPKPRKPTAVLQFQGAYRKDPQRAAARLNEPTPSGDIGTAPTHFTPEQAETWDRIVSLSLPGVLSNADRVIVEELSCAIHARRQSSAATHGLGYDVKLGAFIKSGLEQLGMTPSARSKVQARENEEQKEDSFASV